MTSPNGSGNTPSGTPPNIADLTSGLQQITKNTPKDVKLDLPTLNKYVGAAETFLFALVEIRQKMNNLETLANVGDLPSAMQTKRNLDLDVTGLAGIQRATDQYIAYLSQFIATMSEAGKRLMLFG